VGMLNEAQWEERAIRILGNAAATYSFTSGLSGRLSAGLDQFTNRSRTYDSPNFGPWAGNGGMASAGNVFVNKVTLEGTLNFNRNFGESHEFSGVVGTSYEDNTRERSYVQSEGFPSSEFKMIDSGARVTLGNGNLTEWGLSSVFGRVSHTFNDRLTTTLNVRRDGSSRFGENNRWGTFPSLAVLYRIGEESFMRGQNILGNLAVRASYGRTGNQQDLGDFASRGLFAGGANYQGTPGIAPTQLANPDLKWETTDQLNLGADFSLLTDRLSISFDWYDKRTNDLLVSLPVPSQVGFTSIWSNVGGMKNTGMELALRADLFRGGPRGFNWTSSLSLARNENEVTELYNNQPILGTNAIIVGQPLGVFYGYVADGIFQSIEEVRAHATQTVHSNPLRATAAGDIRFRDLNGDGVINTNDREVIGSPWPDLEGGFSNTITFLNFDLTAFVQFSLGNKVFNGNRIYQDQFGSGGDNHTTRALDRWTPTNTDAKYPRAVWGDPNLNTRVSSFFVEDASYTRLKNLVLGYTLPVSLAEKGGFRSARIYVQGQNLLTSTDYSGWDPEVNVSGQVSVTRGYDFYTLPQARTITFGFNVGL
jgi:TonB-dependent starch-binding outer membrane protein SusC